MHRCGGFVFRFTPSLSGICRTMDGMADVEPTGWSEILAQHTDDVAQAARRLRSTALTGRPDLTERVYRGWRGLGLRHPRLGLVATLFPRADDVIVYFERGATLPDPYGLLEGGDRLRRTRTLTFLPTFTGPAPEHLLAYLDLSIDD